MSALSKTDLKTIFVSGARPTETNFADLIDSFTSYSELLENIGSAISQQTGVLEIVSASATAHSILPTRLGGTGEGSLSSAQDAFFQGQTGLAIVTSANKFTNTNTFAATATNFISSATGSNEGPILVLDKPNSQSDGDNLGAIIIKGADSGGNSSTYAKMRGAIVTTSAGNENGLLQLITITSGGSAVRFNIGGGMYSTNVSGGDKGIDTINVSEIYDDNDRVELSKLDTPQTASDTSVTFTSPFDTVTGAVVMVSAISLNAGNDHIVCQIGPSGGAETSGYIGVVSDNAGATAWDGDGFQLHRSAAAGNVLYGSLILSFSDVTNNSWVCQGDIVETANTRIGSTGGTKSLAGALNLIVIGRDTGGNDSFDNTGSINVKWIGY